MNLRYIFFGSTGLVTSAVDLRLAVDFAELDARDSSRDPDLEDSPEFFISMIGKGELGLLPCGEEEADVWGNLPCFDLVLNIRGTVNKFLIAFVALAP